MTPSTNPVFQSGPDRFPGINEITLDHPWQWIAAGWQDFLKTPVVSLSYGLMFVVVSYLLTVFFLFGEPVLSCSPIGRGVFSGSTDTRRGSL